MNKLNITGNTFPLTVENLQVLQSQTELIQSALLASISLQVSDDSIFLYLIKDANDNKICAYYKGELYSIVIRSSSTTRYFLVEKKVSVSTDTETFADVRLERYLVVGSKEAGETTIKSFDSAAIRLVSLRADLIEKITTAQTTADTASTTATAAQNTAASAMNKAIEAADAAATAQSTADTASTTADTASTTADTALTTANTAKTTAETALENSDAALNAADSAEEKANTASSTANSAETTANIAKIAAETASATANSAKTAVDDALSIRTFIVRGDGDELPNVSIMGTLTCDYKKKYAYLNFKCWTDGNFIAHINVLQAGSDVNFTELMNLSLPNNNFSGNNVAYYQTIKATESPNNSIIDFNLLVKPGYFEKITNLISDNKELVLDVTIPE